jgi:hypothetical protein
MRPAIRKQPGRELKLREFEIQRPRLALRQRHRRAVASPVGKQIGIALVARFKVFDSNGNILARRCLSPSQPARVLRNLA